MEQIHVIPLNDLDEHIESMNCQCKPVRDDEEESVIIHNLFSAKASNSYCLGYTHTKCDTCQHEKNWKSLNQLPDALRLPMQKRMIRISDDKCRMTKMGEYMEANHD